MQPYLIVSEKIHDIHTPGDTPVRDPTLTRPATSFTCPSFRANSLHEFGILFLEFAISVSNKQITKSYYVNFFRKGLITDLKDIHLKLHISGRTDSGRRTTALD